MFSTSSFLEQQLQIFGETLAETADTDTMTFWFLLLVVVIPGVIFWLFDITECCLEAAGQEDSSTERKTDAGVVLHEKVPGMRRRHHTPMQVIPQH